MELSYHEQQALNGHYGNQESIAIVVKALRKYRNAVNHFMNQSYAGFYHVDRWEVESLKESCDKAELLLSGEEIEDEDSESTES